MEKGGLLVQFVMRRHGCAVLAGMLSCVLCEVGVMAAMSGQAGLRAEGSGCCVVSSTFSFKNIGRMVGTD